MFQVSFIDFTILTPVLSLIIIIFLVYLMVFSGRRDIRELVIGVYFFSLIIGSMSISNGVLPFTPYFQLLFILVQTILFVKFIFDSVEGKKKHYGSKLRW